MKIFQKASLILAMALAATWAAAPRVLGYDLQPHEAGAASSFIYETLAAQGATLDEAQDRDQEAREREQEAKDRAQEARDREQEAKERAQEKLDRAQELYDHGTELLDDGKYQQAIEVFNKVSQEGGSSVEGALYWKAYAQYKSALQSEALLTLKSLESGYPKSRWVDEARQLELEMKQKSGQPVSPDTEGGNDDLKLMALNGLMNSDPDHAVPML